MISFIEENTQETIDRHHSDELSCVGEQISRFVYDHFGLRFQELSQDNQVRIAVAAITSADNRVANYLRYQQLVLDYAKAYPVQE